MRVVLDTNVVVSAIFYSGLPSKILSAWLEDRFDLVVSEEILGEYDRTARRFGQKFPNVDLELVPDRIVLHGLLVVPARLPDDACTDPDDIKFLECAVAAGKDFDANVVSVATAPHDDPARKILVLRLERKNYKVLKSAIRKSGFDLVSAD